MKHFAFVISLPRLLLGIAVLGVIAGVSSHQVGQSSAATSYNHNPMGTADYCALSGSTTILYGWAYDADAPAGALPYVVVSVAGHTAQVASDVSGYRDTAINSYIRAHNPGAPTSSIYGWKLSLVGYYKGGRYAVSGTLDNYGTGANVGLPINSASHVDGDASKPYFSGGVIPDACLASAPAPTPAPAPVTNPSTGSSGTTKRTVASSGAAAPAVAAPSANADSTVNVGTNAANITVPAGGASKIHVQYALAGGPAASSDDQATNGNDISVILQGLTPASDYSFQIVRTNSAGTTATSPAASFTTKGYTVSLNFTDNKKKPVANLSGSINDPNNTEAKSDKNGLMSFSGLGSGNYTVSYAYKSRAYTKDFDTTADNSSGVNADGSPKIITLSDTVNVDKLTAATNNSGASSHGSKAGVILLVFVVLALVGGALWFILRLRRNRRLQSEYSSLGASAGPGAADVLDQRSMHEFAKQQPAGQPLPTHAGESLRDMVLESMHSQAAQASSASASIPEPLPSVPPPAQPVPLPPQPLLPTPPPSPAVPPPPDGETIQISHDK